MAEACCLPRLPWLWWVSSQGWGENRAGMGHPPAKPPCPHTTVRGDGIVGTWGQGLPWPQPSAPWDIWGVPKATALARAEARSHSPGEDAVNFRAVAVGCVAVKQRCWQCCQHHHAHTTHGQDGSELCFKRTLHVSLVPCLPGCHKSCPQEEWEIVRL